MTVHRLSLAPTGRDNLAQGETLGGRAKPHKVLKGRDSLSRPFRTGIVEASQTQGCAFGFTLGYPIMSRWDKETDKPN